MAPAEAFAQIDRFGKWTVHRPDVEDVLVAIQSHREKKVTFWEAMILRSAMKSGCDLVWSEDLPGGQRWDGVVVRNPF